MNKSEYWEYRQWLLNTKEGNRQLLEYLMTRKERFNPRCLDCGECCKSCPAYQDNMCSIWKEACRVFHCDNYPLCPQALEKDGLEGICRYYWD